MTALTEPDRTRLIRLLGMCGSGYAGERDNAILAVQRLLRQLELSWDQVLVQPGTIVREQWGQPWRSDIEICIRNLSRLSRWERDFIINLRGFRRLSPKQAILLRDIATKVGAA